MLKELAKEKGYSVGGEEWWDTEEGQRFLMERSKDFRYDLEVDRRLQNLVIQGGYVITSYAIPWLNPAGVKVWLKASQSVRAKRMARRDGISLDKAFEIVRLRDRENSELYKKMYGYEFERDLSVFDLMINTEQVEAEEVAEIIVDYVRFINKEKKDS